MLTAIIDELIDMKKKAKKDDNADRAWAYKLLLVQCLRCNGEQARVHHLEDVSGDNHVGDLVLLERMITIASSCGYEVSHGNMNLIFVLVKGESETTCATTGMKVKKAITELIRGPSFASVRADIKGKYMSIVSSAKKKYRSCRGTGSCRQRDSLS